MNDKDSLAGRIIEIRRVIEAVTTTGRHVAIFGERGVGKTSVAGLIQSFYRDRLKSDSIIVPRVNCEPLQDYATIWSNIADEIEAQCARRGIEVPPGEPRQLLERLKDGDATSNIVRRLCESWPDYLLVIVVDEFDRIADGDTVETFADTIKNLSDHSLDDTLVLVGVADTVDDLIEDHRSIGRNLAQIHLERLSDEEIKHLVKTRIDAVGMSIDDPALEYIARISRGAPYYAHLIGLTTGLAALDAKRMNVVFDDIFTGLSTALELSAEVVQHSYYDATISSRSEIYSSLLLACALAKTDERGYFAPVDIRQPLSKILGRPVNISRYLRPLGELCEEPRGRILEKKGPTRKQRYRFADPLMPSYVYLHSIEAGLFRREDL